MPYSVLPIKEYEEVPIETAVKKELGYRYPLWVEALREPTIGRAIKKFVEGLSGGNR